MVQPCDDFALTGSCERGANHEGHHVNALGRIVVFRALYTVTPEIKYSEFKPFVNVLRNQAAGYGELPTPVLITDGAVAVNAKPHLRGNVYLQFENTEDAANAIVRLNNTILYGTQKLLVVEQTRMLDMHGGECKYYKQGKVYKSCSGRCKRLHFERLEKRDHQTAFGRRQREVELPRD